MLQKQTISCLLAVTGCLIILSFTFCGYRTAHDMTYIDIVVSKFSKYLIMHFLIWYNTIWPLALGTLTYWELSSQGYWVSSHIVYLVNHLITLYLLQLSPVDPNVMCINITNNHTHPCHTFMKHAIFFASYIFLYPVIDMKILLFPVILHVGEISICVSPSAEDDLNSKFTIILVLNIHR